MTYRDTLNSYNQSQTKQWLHDRLHGRDELCPPPDTSDHERRYERVIKLFESPAMSEEFKRHLLNVTVDAIRDAARQYRYGEEGEWTDPEALDSLFLLAVDVTDGLINSEKASAVAQSLTEFVRKLPYLQDGIDLRRLAAMALAETRVGPPAPMTFWCEVWVQALRETPPWTGMAGSVFDGIYRHVGAKEAFAWLKNLESFDTELLSRLLHERLRKIISGSDRLIVANLLEKHLMVPLRIKEHRLAVQSIANDHGLSLWREINVPLKHWPMISQLMKDEHGIDHAIPKNSDRDCILASPEAAAVIEDLLRRFFREKMEFPSSVTDDILWEAVGEGIYIEFCQKGEPLVVRSSKRERSQKKLERLADVGAIARDISIASAAKVLGPTTHRPEQANADEIKSTAESIASVLGYFA